MVGRDLEPWYGAGARYTKRPPPPLPKLTSIVLLKQSPNVGIAFLFVCLLKHYSG